MVFFVQHNADMFAVSDQHASRTFGLSQFAADELTFDQQLGIQFVQCSNVYKLERFSCLCRRDCLSKTVDNLLTRLIVGLSHERITNQVPRKSNSGRNDNIRLRPLRAQPFAACASQFFKTKRFPVAFGHGPSVPKRFFKTITTQTRAGRRSVNCTASCRHDQDHHNHSFRPCQIGCRTVHRFSGVSILFIVASITAISSRSFAAAS